MAFESLFDTLRTEGSVFVENLIVREFLSEVLRRKIKVYAGWFHYNENGKYGRIIYIDKR